MGKYSAVEIGSVFISAVLVLVFFMMLLLGILSNKDVMMHLILIIMTIVALAIYSQVSRIENMLRREKK
jgi:L-asparagine transporter-like permease